MKKVLAVLAVLAIAPLASATYTLTTSGPTNSTLAISSTVDIAAGGGLETYYALVVPTASGSLAGGSPIALTDAGWDIAVNNDAAGAGGIPVPTGTNGVWGEFFTTGGSILAGQLVTGITYTGSAATATLYQVNGSDWSLGPALATAQVGTPEPLTVALLGLGGLFLRKRVA
jgi:hypothetical protein